jgi:hypothetical protein
MKINSGVPSSGLPCALSKPADESKSPAFADVLAKTISANQPEPISAAMPAAAVMRPLAAHPDELCQSTERVLDAMERYQNMLGNDDLTLRAVAPAICELRRAADDLALWTQRVPVDHPVSQIAQQTLLTAAKEIARFDEGVYVDD